VSAAQTLGVLVVPARGGADLEAALAAASWADAQAALDVRADVPVVRGPDTDWLVVLGEAERLTADGARAIRAAIGDATPDQVFALRMVSAMLDIRIELGRPTVRVGPRRSPVVMRAGATLELDAAGRRVRTLDVPILRSCGDTLSDAVDLAGAEATTFAALVDARVAPGRGILWHPLLAGVRALTARAGGRRLGLGRWIVAVFEGYRVVVAYAKLWERQRDRREVAG
jgi:hypothetical protein